MIVRAATPQRLGYLNRSNCAGCARRGLGCAGCKRALGQAGTSVGVNLPGGTQFDFSYGSGGYGYGYGYGSPTPTGSALSAWLAEPNGLFPTAPNWVVAAGSVLLGVLVVRSMRRY